MAKGNLSLAVRPLRPCVRPTVQYCPGHAADNSSGVEVCLPSTKPKPAMPHIRFLMRECQMRLGASPNAARGIQGRPSSKSSQYLTRALAREEG
jgi:hypothetical protein